MRALRAGGRRTSAQSRSESLGFVVALSPCLLLPGFPPSQTHPSGRRQEPRMPRQCEATLCARPRRDCGSLLLSKAEAPAQRGWLRVPPPWPWGQDSAAWHSGAAPGPSRRSCARAPRRSALGDPAARGWAGARTSPPGATRGALRPSASPPALHGSLRPPCSCCPAGRRSRVPWTLFRATLSCGLGRAVAPVRQRVGPRCHCQLPSMFSCGAMAGSVACQTPSW